MKILKKYSSPIFMFALFEAIAVGLWLWSGNIFYFFNFTYIGGFIALGITLYIRKFSYARLVVQLGVGLYMLVYLGLLHGENMQIEGFWFYLFSGVFEAATIHYLIAKIAGPLVFGRGWCGYACWTAMVLDLLPFRQPQSPRRPKLGRLRYLVFGLSLVFVATLFLAQARQMEAILFRSFVVGNLLYYIAGIWLAFRFRDNRAFCKYLCPVTVFLKPMSYYSLSRIKVDPKKCIGCGKCKQVCPMDVDMLENSRSRKNGTECILCMQCVESCPKDALRS